MARKRYDFQTGNLDGIHAIGVTTMTSSELADFPAVTSPDYAVFTFDPNAQHGTPELVKVTAHALSSETASIVRAFEGSTARQHVAGTAWKHGPTAADFNRVDHAYRVKDYGALGDDTTDDTAAINTCLSDAVTDARNAGGGVVEVEFEDATYKIAGALLTTGGCFAQIPLPTVPVSEPKVVLVLRGKKTGGANVHGSQTVKQAGGTIIRSTLTSCTYSATLGTPSVIGGPDKTQVGIGSSTFTNLQVHIRDLTVRVPDNPTLTAVNLAVVAQCDIDRLVVDTNTASAVTNAISHPTHPHNVGLWMPETNNNAHARVGTYTSIGNFLGLKYGEHALVEKYLVWQNVVAMAPSYPYYHDAHFNFVNSEWCRYGIAIVDTTQTTETASLLSSVQGDLNGYSYLSIDSWDHEDHPLDGHWSETVAHVNDPASSIYGTVDQLVVVKGGVGTSNDQPKRNGGFFLQIRTPAPFYDSTTRFTPLGSTIASDTGLASGAVGKTQDRSRRTWSTAGDGTFVRNATGFGMSVAGTSASVLYTDIGVSDVMWTAQLVTNNGAAFPALIARRADANNYLWVNKGEAFKVVSGVFTSLGTFSTASDGDYLDLILLGTTLIVRVNGIERGEWTVPASTATNFGLAMQAETTSRIANLSATAI